MRAGLRELMRYAEAKGFRPPGSNPVDSISTMSVPARGRYITLPHRLAGAGQAAHAAAAAPAGHGGVRG